MQVLLCNNYGPYGYVWNGYMYQTSYWQFILPISYDVPLLLGDYVLTFSPPMFHFMFSWIAHLFGYWIGRFLIGM
jgi:hypothetical protein